MKLPFWKRFFLAPIDVVYENLVNLPVIFFSLFLLIMLNSWKAWIILGLAVLSSVLWDNCYITNRYNCRQYSDMMVFLKKYSHCTFHCYKLEEVLADKYNIHESMLDIFRTGIFSVVFNSQVRESNLGWLCVVQRQKTGENFSGVPKSFLLFDNPSYIMTGDPPDATNIVQLFYIFHELGHLSRHQETIREMYRRNKIQGFMLLLLVIIITNWNIVAILLALFFFFYWGMTGKIISVWHHRLELDADTFAVFALVNHPQFDKIIELAKKVRSKDGKNKQFVEKLKGLDRIVELIRTNHGQNQEALDQDVKWLERSVDWARDQEPVAPDPIRNSFYNYRACTERLRIIPFFVRLLMGIFIAAAAFFGKEPSDWALLILGFMFVILPLILVIKYKRCELLLRSLVELKLHRD